MDTTAGMQEVENVGNMFSRVLVSEAKGHRFDKIVGNDFIRHVLVAHLSGHYATHNVQNLFQTVL